MAVKQANREHNEENRKANLEETDIPEIIIGIKSHTTVF